MKYGIGLIVLFFSPSFISCGPCLEINAMMSPPQCRSFYSEASKNCTGKAFADVSCQKEWSQATYKCTHLLFSKMTDPKCELFYDEAQHCKDQSYNPTCHQKMRKALMKCDKALGKKPRSDLHTRYC